MEIRSTTDQDPDVFVDTVFAAFGRFPETPDEDGRLESMTAAGRTAVLGGAMGAMAARG